MGEKKGISKNGLNNIFNTHKTLSRSEAARKYSSLSQEAREEADGWINRAFYLETGLPSGTKLDPKNPEHSEYVEKWLKQRDNVMGWGRDWEKPEPNMDTRIFRENIPSTPAKTLREKEGIFEQRMSGPEFKKYVIEAIGEVSIYDGKIGRRKGEKPLAINIASKLLANPTWLQNASDSHEGRDAVTFLQLSIARNPAEREELEPSETLIFDKLSKITDPHLEEIAKEQRVKREKNTQNFKDSFPILSNQIQKYLEQEGYQVERIYYRTFTPNEIEIRAETVKQTEANLNTYGYRGDPYVKNIKTERKDQSLGGIDLVSGVFQSSDYFTKHGTAETDWDTQLAIGELAVLAGVGVRALIFGTRSILIRESGTLVKELGEEVIERSMRESIPDSGAARLARDSLDDLQYAKTKPLERKLPEIDPFAKTQLDARPQQVPNPEIKPPSKPPVIQDVKKTQLNRNGGQAIRTREQNIDTLGEETYRKAANMGLDDYTLDKYIDEIQTREVLIPHRFDLLDDVTQKIIKQIDDTWSLGESNAQKLIAYGFDPRDISMQMEGLLAKGLSREQVGASIEQKIKLMDYYRNTYCDGKFHIAKTQLTDSLGAGGDVRYRLASKIHEKMWSDWKASDPKKLGYDYLTSKERNDKMGQLFEEAKEIVKGIEKSVLSPGADKIGLGAAPLLKLASGDKKPLEKKDAQPLPKIREKQREQLKKKTDFKENKH
ncbi:hypothetical protein E4H04_04200 [Candidatus Bathyarchaeota archaeon]|nr:MAG: hypothetical protein E4H04_04200 [Candidatus Bathyarchaeota archaeon]